MSAMTEPDLAEQVRQLRKELDALKRNFTSHATKMVDRVGAIERRRIRIGDLRAG